jgi:nitrite reductase (NADH) small subunit/3-phenylpropionate/trans-cinnamate dioxygenase ferredoxin subunit
MPRFVTVARIGEISDGEAKTVQGPGKCISVFRDGDRYFAIDDMCPHMGASLAGGFVENGIVTCAWHYWRFRLSDGAWADNPRIKIGSYPVHLVDGEIRLELPDSETKPCTDLAPSSPG